MSYNITATLNVIESYLMAGGHYQHVQRGEPKSPPGPGLTAAVVMRDVSIPQVTLTHAVELHTINILIYWNELSEPQLDGESALANVVSQTMGTLAGEYDLGGTIRAVDVAGIYSSGMSAQWGYSEIGGTWFRTVRIELPLIVDDSMATVA